MVEDPRLFYYWASFEVFQYFQLNHSTTELNYGLNPLNFMGFSLQSTTRPKFSFKPKNPAYKRFKSIKKHF